MKYIVLSILLLTGCSTSKLEKRKQYSDVCNNTNVRSVVEEDREITCYPPMQVRLIP